MSLLFKRVQILHNASKFKILQQPLIKNSMNLSKHIQYATYSSFYVQPTKFNLAMNTIRDNPGSKKKKRRLGRGPGSGRGKTAGRGHKGQNARAGNSNPGPGFEGGQTPLYRRFPKRGFTNIFARDISCLNLDKLQLWIDNGRIDSSKVITLKELNDSNIVNFKDGVSLLARGSSHFKSKINIEVTKASKAAIKKIEKLGGTITCVYHNKLAMRALRNPHKFAIIPKFAEPTNVKILQWYSNSENRGYLAPKPE